jgi:hypothetical protein
VKQILPFPYIVQTISVQVGRELMTQPWAGQVKASLQEIASGLIEFMLEQMDVESFGRLQASFRQRNINAKLAAIRSSEK